jgi:acetyl-CoA decarbonylase/synthase complex subunit gamma
MGAIKARWALNRMDYAVSPGLYAAGNPGPESPVLVTANYKLSFDHLRKWLPGRDVWILVLDTKGINVWCAAGKGTFGTDELVRRVQISGLERIVTHRKLILPQLGAPGVCAHQVKDRCGFRVIYGPVRAKDLPTFLDAGFKADPEMRRVHFGLRDRTILIPVEVVVGVKYMLLAAAILLLLSGFNLHGYALERVRSTGMQSAALVLIGFLSGAVLGPLLLPWLPGRSFALKGGILGAAIFGLLFMSGFGTTLISQPILHTVCWALMIPTLASFTVMNFTGASTFTSLSGVLREMRIAVPIQIAAAVIGLGLWITGLFLPGGPMA